MINKLEIENLGPISSAKIESLGRFNLIIGENGVGDSVEFIALYWIEMKMY